MAFNRLRDIRDRMESKWTSGEFIFGYEDDINENHNIDYPLLLVTPPNSVLPATEKDPINAHLKEEYDFEVLFAKPYRTSSTNTGATDSNTNLDVIYTLLEAEAYNWIQSFLDSYASKEVTLVPTPITIERETNQHNDKVVQIRMGFTVDCFSHAFASFDDQMIRDLTPLIWLRSDIGVKTQYQGGKEVVSQWNDQSGNGHHFAQATAVKQPEYNYEFADSTNTENRHPFIDFDGTDDHLACVNETLDASISGGGLSGNHTIFWIAKTNNATTNTGAILAVNAETAALADMSITLRSNGTGDIHWLYAARESTANGGSSASVLDTETSNSVIMKVRGFLMAHLLMPPTLV